MLHDINAPIPSSEEAIKREYQRIVGESGDAPVSLSAALSDAADITMKNIDLGEVEAPPIREALISIGKSVDKKQGAASDGVISRLARGEVDFGMEGDPFLSTVVTLGGGRRKSWRYVTGQDLQEMHQLRRENFDKAKSALERFELDYESVLPVVFEFRTVGEAVHAGAFTAVKSA